MASGCDCKAGEHASYYIKATPKKVAAYEAAKLASEFDPKIATKMSITMSPSWMNSRGNSATSPIGLGQVGGDISMEFKECCPTEEQKKLALGVQRKLADSYNELASKPHPTKEDVDNSTPSRKPQRMQSNT